MRFSIPQLTVIATIASASLCSAGGVGGQVNTAYDFGYATAPAAGTAMVVTSPATAAPYVSGTSSYSAAYPPPAATPYYGIAPAASASSIVANGSYQAQRPAYYDNPSVYTGLPVVGNLQTSYRAPLSTSPLTAQAFPSASYQSGYGASSSAYYGVAPSSYAAAYPGTVDPGQPVVLSGDPGFPATTVPVVPAAPAPVVSPPSGGCFGRFCRKLFGTSYTTSYYRAPVTYYRPVTTLNPTTGATVTVQQPCTSYEQQVQRTPFTTFQPAGPPAVPSTNCGPSSATGGCNAAPYAQQAPFGSPTAPAVGQVNALGSGDNRAVPIPSIPPGGQVYPQAGSSNLAPLTGAPPTLAPPSYAPASPTESATSPATIAPPSAAPGGDMSPMTQPSLNKTPTEASPTEAKSPFEAKSDRPPSYWQLQSAEDSTAMIPRSTDQAPQPDPVSLSGNDGAAQPIRAPADYVAPFGRPPLSSTNGTQAVPNNTTVSPANVAPLPSSSPNGAPPRLPKPSYDPSDLTSASYFGGTPAQDVSLRYDRRPDGRATQPRPFNKPRDTTWISIE